MKYFSEVIVGRSRIIGIYTDLNYFIELVKNSYVDIIKKQSFVSYFNYKININNYVKLFCLSENMKCRNCGDEPNTIIEFKTLENPSMSCVLFFKRVKVKQQYFYKKFESDHIIPKSCGGIDTIFNRQILCAECNDKKADFLPEHTIKFRHGDIRDQIKQNYNNDVFQTFYEFYCQDYRNSTNLLKGKYLTLEELYVYREMLKEKFNIEFDISKLSEYRMPS